MPYEQEGSSRLYRDFTMAGIVKDSITHDVPFEEYGLNNRHIDGLAGYDIGIVPYQYVAILQALRGICLEHVPYGVHHTADQAGGTRWGLGDQFPLVVEKCACIVMEVPYHAREGGSHERGCRLVHNGDESTPHSEMVVVPN
jgi:hypothetical protein